MSVLFIHGWASNANVWPVALKGPHSIMYNSTCTFPDYQHLADVFLTFWQKSKSPVTLVGWSMGGMLALQLAFAHPEKIHKVVLISSTARFTTCESYTAGLRPSAIKNLSRKLSINKWKAQLDFYQSMFSLQEKVFTHEFLTHTAPYFEDILLDTLEKGLHYLLLQDLRELLPRINTPCYILHGTDDTICPIESAFFLANNLKKSELLILKDTGHIPFYTRLDDVVDLCLRKELKND